MLSSWRATQSVDLVNRLQSLEGNAPFVLRYMFNNEQERLGNETDNVLDVVSDNDSHKWDMSYTQEIEKRQRKHMKNIRLKFIKTK
jgi:predicted O-linked N-acetylglucosamine transferase (SPINDLY family)